MKRFLALTLAVALAFIGVPVPLAAAIGPQGPGSISGIAKGGDQQPLPNYTVRLRGAKGELLGTQTTNSLGGFSFTGLNAGSYTVEIVDAAGNIVGVTSPISLTAGAMTISGVALTASGASGAALAGAATGGGLGSFFSSTAGILLIVGAGAGITAGVLASRNASPSR